MLQRLFARHGSEERTEDVAENGSAGEERDALRERSAVILERLARKQATARQQEIEARRIAREAHVPALPPQTEAEASKTGETQADAPTETGEAAATAEETSAVADTAKQDFEAPAAGQKDDATGAAEPAQEAVASHGNDYFSDDAPLRSGGSDDFETRSEAPPARPPADDGNAPEPPEDAPSSEAEPTPDIHDDPEALEQIRKKAEEAKARIAARLQDMQGDAGAEDGPGEQVDLGEDTPPIAPEHDEN